MSSDGGCVSKSFAVRCDGDKVKLIVTQGEANPSRLAPMEKGACPSGAFNALGHAGSAVDYLERLAECLDTCDLASLAGTCHALRDGRFTRAQCGKQCLQSELHKRRRHCIHTFELKLGLGSFEGEVLDLRQDGVADSDQRRLTAADARVLAGLFMQHPADVKMSFHFPECDPIPISVFHGETYKLCRNTPNVRCRNRNLDIAFLTKILVYNVMTSLDLSFSMLRAEGAKTLVDGGAFKGSLTSINLAGNELCGLDYRWGSGTYTAEGIIALSEAIRVSGSLTSIDLGFNSIGKQVALKLIRIFIEKKTMVSVGLGGCDLGPEEAEAVVELIRVSGSLTNINLSDNQLCGVDRRDRRGRGTYTAEGITAISEALRVNGSLTECNLQSNNLGKEGWTTIFTALRDSNISKISTWDLHAETGIKESVNVLAEYISVSGSLTSLNLRGTCLCGLGIKALAPAIRDSGSLTSIDLAVNRLCGVYRDWSDGGRLKGTYTTEGIIALSEAIRVSGSLTKLSLRSNSIRDEGVSAVCEAIMSNKETKITELDFCNNGITRVGAKPVAAMIAVTASLTSLDLSHNFLMAEGAKALAPAIRVNGSLTSINLAGNALTDYGRDMSGIKELSSAISVCGSLTSINLAANGFGAEAAKALTPAIIALSEAIRDSASLTSINLAANELTGEGIIALSEAIRVSGSLTACDLQFNFLDEQSKQLLRDSVKGRPSFKLTAVN